VSRSDGSATRSSNVNNRGNIYVAREIGDMSWNCALTVKTRDTWRAWRTNVLCTFFCAGQQVDGS
jgi:hypothetical protein